MHGSAVAAVVFQRRQHVINLFIAPGAGKSARVSSHRYNLLEWSDAGMSYWAVSDLNVADLITFREAYLAER